MATEIIWESKRRGNCETLKNVPPDGEPTRILFEDRWYHVIGGMCTKCSKPIVSPYVHGRAKNDPDYQPVCANDMPDRYIGQVEAYHHEDCDKSWLSRLV